MDFGEIAMRRLLVVLALVVACGCEIGEPKHRPACPDCPTCPDGQCRPHVSVTVAPRRGLVRVKLAADEYGAPLR